MISAYQISTELCRQTFADALREQVGAGKHRSVEAAGDDLGIDQRTLRSYLAGENLPPLTTLMRMFHVFGAAFTNRILRLADIGGAIPVDAHEVSDLELNADAAKVLGDLGQGLRKGFLVAGDKRKLCAEVRALMAVGGSWLAENDPLPQVNPKTPQRNRSGKGRG